MQEKDPSKRLNILDSIKILEKIGSFSDFNTKIILNYIS